MDLLHLFKRFSPSLIIFLTPLALSPLIFNGSQESKCAFVVLLMTVYWATEPIPLAVTSLLPVILLPILGLSTSEQACAPYMKSANMLFMGCLTLALAIEKSNLHERIALKVLLKIGNQFQLIVLGFMLTTMFLSMWIVSTAAVAMMLPIADAILAQIFPKNKQQHLNQLNLNGGIKLNGNSNGAVKSNDSPEKITIPVNGMFVNEKTDNYDKEHKAKLSKLLYLSIGYSATIGGVTTLTSNGPNMVMKFVLEE